MNSIILKEEIPVNPPLEELLDVFDNSEEIPIVGLANGFARRRTTDRRHEQTDSEGTSSIYGKSVTYRAFLDTRSISLGVKVRGFLKLYSKKDEKITEDAVTGLLSYGIQIDSSDLESPMIMISGNYSTDLNSVFSIIPNRMPEQLSDSLPVQYEDLVQGLVELPELQATSADYTYVMHQNMHPRDIHDKVVKELLPTVINNYICFLKHC